MSSVQQDMVDLDLSNASDQLASAFFNMLTPECRDHIYRQYWNVHGQTQHLFMFGPNSYIVHYPCLLGKDAFKDYPDIESESEAESDSDQAGDSDQDDDEQSGTYSGSDNAEESEQDDAQDDPGDVNGAIQQIAGPPPQGFPAPPPGANAAHWEASPWCNHMECFRGFMKSCNMGYQKAFSRNYRKRDRPSFPSEIIKPLLVCKRMYEEASKSLFTNVRFSFMDMRVLNRFNEAVPRGLRQKIKLVDIMANVLVVPEAQGGMGIQRLDQAPEYPAGGRLSELCNKLLESFPEVKDLQITMHLDRRNEWHIEWRSDRAQGLPGKAFFEPLLSLAGGNENLTKLDVKLPIHMEGPATSAPYGEVDVLEHPRYASPSKVHVALVPRGWHGFEPDLNCVGLHMSHPPRAD